MKGGTYGGCSIEADNRYRLSLSMHVIPHTTNLYYLFYIIMI